ncbi:MULTISPECIES: cobalt-precorrin-6A reductase [unclassified Rhizobium]|uniref:cobalt-precorrin-6A reductase n=1 Tax=unclassified Rhizobium TaxID=2613769 RepID=UPI0006FA787D|nr:MULTISPECIES: cobalt-precorrin-6A reductase [unclassified Rhizobium]KQV34982.1 cobalt-precorrin-6X reductase [Rhizobium sp. Root1212]KRD24786.1 cobalt-precorrin-6X reductase [Rhizobium sp. Root268]
MRKPHILILGGTTESRRLAGKLAERGDLDITLSLAGRTETPMAQPVPVRSGGFGGPEGLAAYLRNHAIDLMIDATHPFAARISANAAEASGLTGTPLVALRRPAWERQQGDRWTSVATMTEAAAALGETPKRVFLAIGRQEAFHFECAPQHHYLVRSVDPVTPPLAVPDVRYILSAGPFAEADEYSLLTENRIDIIVAKNSGGDATHGKIAAARRLGLPVIMVERRPTPDVQAVGTVAEALLAVDHILSPAMKRGV